MSSCLPYGRESYPITASIIPFTLDESYAQPFLDFSEELKVRYALLPNQALFLSKRIFYTGDESCCRALGISFNSLRDWRYPRGTHLKKNFVEAYKEYEGQLTQIYSKLLQNTTPHAIVRINEALDAVNGRGEPDHFARLRAAEDILKATGMLDGGAEVEKDKMQSGFYGALTALINEKRAFMALEATKTPKIDIIEAEVRELTSSIPQFSSGN